MAIIKKTQKITGVGEDAEKVKSICIPTVNVEWGSHYGKQNDDS
jgi:hypothetical protein